MNSGPAFGQADLTNCEKELIHLAASIQPHGVLLVIGVPDFRILQVSANVESHLGIAVPAVLDRPLTVLGGDIESQLRRLHETASPADPVPVQCHTFALGHLRELEGSVHRYGDTALIVELEPIGGGDSRQVGLEDAHLLDLLATAVQRFSNAASIAVLADHAVRAYRELTGYDRVMVYRFDPDGHGKIVAEARHARLDSLLGHHYPASDIPQRARDLYIRTRVRVLVDVDYQPAPLVPRLFPPDGKDLDMSLCHLRSMSPLHLQYLKNMGVTATLVVSIVREGRLWGLIAAHHYAPRDIRYSLRMAAEMLAEIISTRIAAIENYAHAQVGLLVRRLEQRLVEATSSEGDWRLALFRNPRTLLQPLEASGAALFCDDEILTAGEVPSTPELRALLQWIHGQDGPMPFHCASVARANPALQSLTPIASGVLAVRLSKIRPDYLIWFRKEQLHTVTWAGDPSKPVLNNDPLTLSPRRSFAAWSEIVRGTALPWSTTELALARAFGSALVDIILQVQAVRMLIAEHQIGQIRATIANSVEPVLIADARGAVLFANDAFSQLVGRAIAPASDLLDLAHLFTEPDQVASTLRMLQSVREPWRGPLVLDRASGEPIAVNARAEVVAGSDGALLGFILILIDLSDHNRSVAAREHLERAISDVAAGGSHLGDGPGVLRESDSVITAILTNATVAAMDIAEATGVPSVAPLLEELEASTKRATTLYSQLRAHRRSD